MTARRPRRRRKAPATSLPRPATTETQGEARQPLVARRERQQIREHHVSRDFSYVRNDLIWVAAISATAVATIVIAWLLNPTW